jgi:non-ribosomal peptide synthetase component F
MSAERLAVKDGDRTLTYLELNRAANRVAHAIISRSDTSQKFVAVFLQPGFSSAIALLGIYTFRQLESHCGLKRTVFPGQLANLGGANNAN